MWKTIIRILFSLVAFSLMIAHMYCPAVQFDFISLILLGIVFLPYAQPILKFLKVKDFIGISTRDENPETYTTDKINLEENDIVLKPSTSQKIYLKNEKTLKNVLQVKARINFLTEAGSSYILKIKVNGIEIDQTRLINKPLIKEYTNGKKMEWYSSKSFLWNLQYSPNFLTNYIDSRYRVINGDPYIFLFNISNIQPTKNNEFVVELYHGGSETILAHQNFIVCREVVLL